MCRMCWCFLCVDPNANAKSLMSWQSISFRDILFSYIVLYIRKKCIIFSLKHQINNKYDYDFITVSHIRKTFDWSLVSIRVWAENRMRQTDDYTIDLCLTQLVLHWIALDRIRQNKLAIAVTLDNTSTVTNR